MRSVQTRQILLITQISWVCKQRPTQSSRRQPLAMGWANIGPETARGWLNVGSILCVLLWARRAHLVGRCSPETDARRWRWTNVKPTFIQRLLVSHTSAWLGHPKRHWFNAPSKLHRVLSIISPETYSSCFNNFWSTYKWFPHSRNGRLPLCFIEIIFSV